MKTTLGCLIILAVLPAVARAETWQLPLGGAPIVIPNVRVLCGSPPAGFSTDERRRILRPPVEGNPRVVEIHVAEGPASCGKAKEVTVRVTAAWPEIDPAQIQFHADAGLLELHGHGLRGAQVAWQAGARKGSGTCLDVNDAGKTERCTLLLERRLPSNTVFSLVPDGGLMDAETFNAQGDAVPPASRELRPARIVLDQILPPTEVLDVAQGQGQLALPRPEAVASVDCGAARCELSDAGIAILGMPSQATTVSIRFRLAPRFFVVRGDKLENTVTASLPLLRCPMSIISGPPLRDTDEHFLVVKIEPRCGHPTRVRWFVAGEPAKVTREIRRDEGDFIVLQTARLAGGQVTITAVRSDANGSTLGSVTTNTTAPPRPRSILELPGYGTLDFIPTNREAVLQVAGASPKIRLVPLSTEGSTRVRQEGARFLVRADQAGGGLANLRFGYRVSGLPEELSQLDLAVLTENLQRPLREASIPVAFGKSDARKEPLVELVCSDGKGGQRTLVPGQPERIPFAHRDTCRVILHAERLRPEEGTQEVVLEVEVSKPNGGKRSEAGINERMVLHAGGEPRLIFMKTGSEPFDHLVVRLSHVIDEARYLLGPLAKQRPPQIQWTATLEGGFARLYVTLAIPAGLYRMNDPVASMSLNFGVLGRLTTLNRRGKEGVLGIETGLLGVSLIPQRENNAPAFPRTLAAILGIGLRVEVGEGAAVGVHLWGAYEFRKEYSYTREGDTSPMNASHWSLVFGPSISIGSVGTNL
jgi:hypothetical protein